MPVKLQLRIANQQLCAYTIRDTSGSAVVKTDFRGATVGHIDKFALARETSAGTPMKLNRKEHQASLPAFDLYPEHKEKNRFLVQNGLVSGVTLRSLESGASAAPPHHQRNSLVMCLSRSCLTSRGQARAKQVA